MGFENGIRSIRAVFLLTFPVGGKKQCPAGGKPWRSMQRGQGGCSFFRQPWNEGSLNPRLRSSLRASPPSCEEVGPLSAPESVLSGSGTKTQGGGPNHFRLHPQTLAAPLPLLGAVGGQANPCGLQVAQCKNCDKNTLWFGATQMWGGLSAGGTEAGPPYRHLTFQGPLCAQTGVTAI